MRALVSRKTLSQIGHEPAHYNHQWCRYFAKWTAYKPQPKPKLHQKLRTIKTLKAHIENSYLVSPLPCHGFSANQFKSVKNPLPDDPSAAKVVVVKNSLVAKAFEGTEWEKLGKCMKGMNSLLFVKKEEAVGSALGGVKKAVKERKMEFNDFTGAVVGGQLYKHLDLELLEKMPSKSEMHAMLLGSIYGPSSTLMAVLEGIGSGDDAEKADAPAAAEVEAKDSGEAPAP